MPTELVPRYIDSLTSVEDIGGVKELEAGIRDFYSQMSQTSSVSMTIHTSSELTRCISRSHEIKVDFEDKCTAKVELEDPSSLTDDSFKLLFSSKDLNKP